MGTKEIKKIKKINKNNKYTYLDDQSNTRSDHMHEI